MRQRLLASLLGIAVLASSATGTAIVTPWQSIAMDALTLAANGEDRALRDSLAAGLPIETADEYGRTLLFIAVKGDHRRTARMLVRLGATVDAKDKDGWTPLMEAAVAMNEGIVSDLVGAGANVNAGDNDGRSVIDRCVFYGTPASRRIVRFLVKKGADTNLGDKSGTTPLMLAASQGDCEMVSLLLKLGARPCDRNLLGHSALDLARERLLPIDPPGRQIVRLLERTCVERPT